MLDAKVKSGEELVVKVRKFEVDIGEGMLVPTLSNKFSDVAIPSKLVLLPMLSGDEEVGSGPLEEGQSNVDTSDSG